MYVAKSINHTIQEQAKYKILCCPYSEHKALYGKSQKHLEKYINQLCENVVNWAYWQKQNPDPFSAMTLEDFYDEVKIWDWTVRDWEKRYPQLKEANQQALRILGRIREAGALNKRYDAGTVAAVQWHYSDTWAAKRNHDDQQKLKQNEAASQPFIVLPQYPNSPLVPQKK